MTRCTAYSTIMIRLRDRLEVVIPQCDDSDHIDNWLLMSSQCIVRNMHYALQRALRMSTD